MQEMAEADSEKKNKRCEAGQSEAEMIMNKQKKKRSKQLTVLSKDITQADENISTLCTVMKERTEECSLQQQQKACNIIR